MTVEIYSDIACPWCYIGERRFGKALEGHPRAEKVKVVFRPFQLDPRQSDIPRPLAQALASKFGARLQEVLAHTAAVAREDGLDLRFDRAQAVNTLRAHQLLHFALENGGPEVQRNLSRMLFKAYFTEGENVADDRLLADLATSVGLDRDDALVYLSVGEGEAEVLAEIAEANRLGIQAVPTFVFDGRFVVQGAQTVSTFAEALDELFR